MIDLPSNMQLEDDWVNPNAPPHFDDVASGLAFMDEQEKLAILELEAEAQRRMALDQDPTQQNYFLRVDKRTVVRSEKEYVYCELHGIPMKLIPYTAAVQAIKEQEARERQRDRAKAKKKTAKKARKRNR